MHNESISQAEIDALVRGLSDDGKGAPAMSAAGGETTAAMLGDLLSGFVQRAAQALSDLVGTPCQGSLVEVRDTTVEAAAGDLSGQMLFGRTALGGSLTGNVLFAVPTTLALGMITQIYGGVAPSALDDSALGALADGLTQMNQAGLTVAGDLLGRPAYGGAIEVIEGGDMVAAFGVAQGSPVVEARMELVMGEESGRFHFLLPATASDLLVRAVKERRAGKAQPAASAQAPTVAPAPVSPVAQQQVAAKQVAAAAAVAPGYAPARFPEMTPRRGAEETRNIDLLLDVNLQVTVELGRTRKQIRDVLGMGPGSVLELDRLAGEQVDVLVNGKLIAKGEVVVIDENYGVRITDIISPVERVQSFR